MFSINDELIAFKKRVQEKGIVIEKFEKVGNGNMAAFKMSFHLKNNETNSKEVFFWRHDLDNFEQQLYDWIEKQ